MTRSRRMIFLATPLLVAPFLFVTAMLVARTQADEARRRAATG